jgi:two-component system cell cycle response regulator
MTEKMHVLVVDDNQVNLKLVRVLLTSFGYEAHTAENAEQAVELLKTLQPDLILMDIQLPGMDGLALTRQLKADPRFAQVPIVALTAYAMKGDDARALAAGCAGYITKPIDTRIFLTRIAGFLAVPQSGAASPAGAREAR